MLDLVRETRPRAAKDASMAVVVMAVIIVLFALYALGDAITESPASGESPQTVPLRTSTARSVGSA